MAEETTPNQASEQPTPEAKTAADPIATPAIAAEPLESDPSATPPAKQPAAKKPAKTEGEAPAAKPAAKKEKPPALEDKPFNDFIQQDYLPNLKAALAKQGVSNPTLTFEKRKIQIAGFTQAPDCWQVTGHWIASGTQPREFSIYFFDEDIKGKKGFSNTEGGNKPSTLESFLIDERKVDLSLLVDRTLQRLNAQKWLVRN